jgi:hypothetical protein
VLLHWCYLIAADIASCSREQQITEHVEQEADNMDMLDFEPIDSLQVTNFCMLNHLVHRRSE